jgi:hypothetical protein
MKVTFALKDGSLFINGHRVLKAWESYSGWYWFATRKAWVQDSVIDNKVVTNDQIWYGFVQGIYEEWGTFSQAELDSLKGKVWEIPPKNIPHSGRRENVEEVIK